MFKQRLERTITFDAARFRYNDTLYSYFKELAIIFEVVFLIGKTGKIFEKSRKFKS